MFESDTAISAPSSVVSGQHLTGVAYTSVKRGLDIGFSLLLLPLVGCISLLLCLANPLLNPGPVFFFQPRMGRGCRAFMAIKFRTMRPSARMLRGAYDPVEADRLMPLGRFLRRVRIDELPQLVNVLRGEMSLIGPRPDYFHHARHYLHQVPGYRDRYTVRPGISGLAQVDLGYAEGLEATRLKVTADLDYIRNFGLRMDLRVFWRTLVVVLRGRGV